MTLVKQLLESKEKTVWSISPDASVYEALVLMAEKNVGSLVALDDGKLVGILSERDFARKVILQKKASTKIPVKEIMSTTVYCVAPDSAIEQCMALMTEKRIRHLPVLKGDELVGIVSIGDVVKAIMSTQEFIIEQLENYIVSGG
jgi:CBS domain-containing protein